MGDLDDAPSGDIRGHQSTGPAQPLKPERACCRAVVWDLLPWMAAAEMPASFLKVPQPVGPMLGCGENKAFRNIQGPG